MAINPFMIPELSQTGIIPQSIQDQLSQQATKAGTTSSLLGLAFGQDIPQAYAQGIESARNIYGTGLDQLFKQSLARQRTNPFASINPEQFTPESVKAFQQSDTSGTGQYDFSLLKKAIDPFQAQVATNEIAFAMFGQRFEQLTPEQRRQVLTQQEFKPSVDTNEIAFAEFGKSFKDLSESQRKSVLQRQQSNKIALEATKAGETSYLKTAGTKTAEYDVKMINEVIPQAKRNVSELQNALKLIEEGDVNTGFSAELKTNLQRVQNFFKQNPELVNQISDTELLNSVLGRDVFKAIGQLGIGARGIDTPAEREFLRQVLTGTITLEKSTLKRLTQDRLERELAAINQYNTDLAGGRYKRYTDTFGVKLDPVDVNAATTVPKVIRYVPDPNNPGQIIKEER